MLDNPQNGHFRPPTIRCKAGFKDYCMFKPECGIYVNLGIATWNCDGESPSSGVLTTNLIAGPFGPDNSDEFPVWSDFLPEGKGSKKQN
jgi:hypothetical protein